MSVKIQMVILRRKAELCFDSYRNRQKIKVQTRNSILNGTALAENFPWRHRAEPWMAKVKKPDNFPVTQTAHRQLRSTAQRIFFIRVRRLISSEWNSIWNCSTQLKRLSKEIIFLWIFIKKSPIKSPLWQLFVEKIQASIVLESMLRNHLRVCVEYWEKRIKLNQSINQSRAPATTHSIKQSIDRSFNPLINQSINQSINQTSISHWNDQSHTIKDPYLQTSASTSNNSKWFSWSRGELRVGCTVRGCPKNDLAHISLPAPTPPAAPKFFSPIFAACLTASIFRCLIARNNCSVAFPPTSSEKPPASPVSSSTAFITSSAAPNVKSNNHFFPDDTMFNVLYQKLAVFILKQNWRTSYGQGDSMEQNNQSINQAISPKYNVMTPATKTFLPFLVKTETWETVDWDYTGLIAWLLDFLKKVKKRKTSYGQGDSMEQNNQSINQAISQNKTWWLQQPRHFFPFS